MLLGLAQLYLAMVLYLERLAKESHETTSNAARTKSSGEISRDHMRRAVKVRSPVLHCRKLGVGHFEIVLTHNRKNPTDCPLGYPIVLVAHRFAHVTFATGYGRPIDLFDIYVYAWLFVFSKSPWAGSAYVGMDIPAH